MERKFELNENGSEALKKGSNQQKEEQNFCEVKNEQNQEEIKDDKVDE